MSDHLDEFTALRHAAGDVADDERQALDRHLSVCAACAATLAKIRSLDAGLRRVLTHDPGLLAEEPGDSLQPGDPFHRRPYPNPPLRTAPGENRADELAIVRAAEDAINVRDNILAAMATERLLRETLGSLSTDSASARFGLLYALQESGIRIAASPNRALALATAVLDWARPRNAGSPPSAPDSLLERALPLLAVRAQAHEVAAQALIWTKELEQAGTHLALAYRCIGRSTGDELALAAIEHIESQRRSFLGQGVAAMILARRALATFEDLRMEDRAARGWVAVGLAFFALGRQEEAVAAYRRALPVFASHELWSNYVGALNSIGTSLHKLGRLDEARREYAKALRRFSREDHRSWQGYLHHGLADVLFAAGRYRDATVPFARAEQSFTACGMHANALIAMLAEVESWARSGDRGRAGQRLHLFSVLAARRGALDPSVQRQLDQALSGEDPDYAQLALLRQRAVESIQERFREPTA